ncbi:MAG: BMP family ABC transporter substrate-binding protein [Clostridiales bacterium]|nr:BMP family ABC transporter substrate-binding protein [Clostridiales bacterium]
MKKFIATLLVGIMILGLAACGSKNSNNDGKQDAGGTNTKPTKAPADNGNQTADKKKAILIVNGNLGDLGFFDSANAGMQRVKNELGLDIQVIETGDDESKWEPALADAAEEDVDYVIAVSPSMVEPMQNIAPQYPEKKFLLLDNTVDFGAGDFSNVYCATFKQNEGSFLAGAVAAILAKETGKIGFVGGMDIPPINDFLVGFIEGALVVNPNAKVIATYPGDYYDPAKGKEHGIVLCDQGCEVIFPAAGPTGLGTIEAAVEAGRYVIGVDSDQSAGYAANGDTKTAQKIATSMLKNVGDAIFRAIDLDLKGQLKMGQAESLGIAEGGVGLAKNDVYNSILTDAEKKQIEDIEAKVVNGEIKVSTAIGMTTEELDNLRNRVAP